MFTKKKEKGMKKIVLLSFLLTTRSQVAHKADLIIFSFDRPLQLYALLESTERYVKNLGDIHVIYRSSNERYEYAYQDVFKRFTTIVPIKQGNNPKDDFKPLTIKSFNKTAHDYVIFAVDDIVVQNYIDCAHCIEILEKTDAYGFYLRLGKNTTYCYALNTPQRIPPLQEVLHDVYAWTFGAAEHDWRYPHTVDMTLYRKKDIKQDLTSLSYKAPNSCEGAWAGLGHRVINRKGLCYGHSKIVNIPLNKVQAEYNNRNENSISPVELLELFERGFKMDIDPLHTIENTSAHMAYVPLFIARNNTR